MAVGESNNKLVELDANQLIDFISAISQLGSETNQLKVNFDLYFKEIIARYPTKNPFIREKIREQLRKIPAIIRSSLDPDVKMITMQKYNAAIIQLILEDLVNQKHAQFFKIKASEKTKALVKKLLKKRKAKAEIEIDLENYEHNLTARQDQTERMAILALSLSIEERIAFLEQHQTELSYEVCEKIYEALEKSGVFNNLIGIDGNPLIMNEQMQKDIVQALTNNYIDGFIEFSMQRQMVGFDEARNFPEQDPPILYGYANNGNNLFEEYHRHIQNQMHTKVNSALQDINIRANRPGVEGLGSHFHNEVRNNKGTMMEIANERRELIQAKSVLRNTNNLDNVLDTKTAISGSRKNRFNAP